MVHSKGVTEVGTDYVDVKFVQHESAAGVTTQVDYQENGIYRFTGDVRVINSSGEGVIGGNELATVTESIIPPLEPLLFPLLSTQILLMLL